MSEADRTNTLEGINPPGEGRTSEVLRNRRLFYGATTTVISLILLAALIGAVTDVETFGVESAHVRRSSGGYDLEVTYGTVSRPALATPFAIEVHRAGGFDGPITIAVDHDYMSLWDENGFYPTPSAETTMGDQLLWEFDPPTGETLEFTYDARIAPSVQKGEVGTVAVMEGDVPVVQVEFETRIWP